MINRTRARKSLKRKQGRYKWRDFRMIFEIERRRVIPYETLNYLEDIDYDIRIDNSIMKVMMINERNGWMNADGARSLLQIVSVMKKRDVWHFWVLIDVYWTIRRYKSITNNVTYVRKIDGMKIPYREKDREVLFDRIKMRR
jgi:hypothetical protein